MVAAILVAAAAVMAAGPGERRAVVVTDPVGSVLARLPLDSGGAFELRYRNSLYGTLVRERFRSLDDGGFRLEELAAEQLAVLEEYYAASVVPRPGASGWWTAPPPYDVELDELRVAATDLGRRTLLVTGQPPLDLWRLVPDGVPTVIISVEGGR